MSISEILNNYPDHGKQNSYYFYFYLAWLGINTWKRKMCWLLFTIHVRIFSILQENYTSIKSTFCLIMMWWRPFPMKPMLKYTKLSSVTVSYEYMKLFKDWWQFLFGSFEITLFLISNEPTTARDALRTTSISRFRSLTNNLNFLNQSKHV